MNARILDTETHDLHGLPIEIAHVPCQIENGELRVFADNAFDEYFSVGQPIRYGAMAVHHILESDIVGKPSYTTFRLPENVEYIIGHNIDYDIAAISRCGVVQEFKAICTLALARHVWPNEKTHNLSALIYMIMEGSDLARQKLRNAHNAKQDVLMTGYLLKVMVRELNIQSFEELYQVSEEARIPKIMPVGKHKGSPINKIPADDIAWFLKQPEVDPYLRKALQAA